MRAFLSRLAGMILGLFFGLGLSLYYIAITALNTLVAPGIMGYDFTKLLISRSPILLKDLISKLNVLGGQLARNIKGVLDPLGSRCKMLLDSLLNVLRSFPRLFDMIGYLLFALFMLACLVFETFFNVIKAGVVTFLNLIQLVFSATFDIFMYAAYLSNPLISTPLKIAASLFATAMTIVVLPMFGFIIGLIQGVGPAFSMIFGRNRVEVEWGDPRGRRPSRVGQNAQAWLARNYLGHLPLQEAMSAQAKNGELRQLIEGLNGGLRALSELKEISEAILNQHQCSLTLTPIQQIQNLITVEFTTSGVNEDKQPITITHHKVFEKDRFLEMINSGQALHYVKMPEDRRPLTGPGITWVSVKREGKTWIQQFNDAVPAAPADAEGGQDAIGTIKIYPGISPSLLLKIRNEAAAEAAEGAQPVRHEPVREREYFPVFQI